ncbi:hypothetical protein MCEMKE14_01019 [Candidatus Nanopelagicaceae bacterium]|jgi:hypothetical protein
MKIVYAAIAGAVLGACATLLHIFLFPLGLLLGLSGSILGIWALGRMWQLRKYKVIAAISWLYVVVQGSTLGVGGELLIQGDLAGSLLVLLGTLSLVIAVFLPV